MQIHIARLKPGQLLYIPAGSVIFSCSKRGGGDTNAVYGLRSSFWPPKGLTQERLDAFARLNATKVLGTYNVQSYREALKADNTKG
mmetsp:Transcript_142396/g.442786  ORF Transcript_142396/g.442786 Transcript_142396/m.442786 type:complete len:86 (-) Transcript_142396:143-400(-)